MNPSANDNGPLRVGAILQGRYRLEAELGSGAMGSVYRARTLEGAGPGAAAQVAVKVLRPELIHDARTVVRFEQEARAVGRLRHANVVHLIDVGRTAGGELFLVMELAEGVPLSQVIARDAPLPMRRIIRLARQIASALREAHEQGFIHRDLKPDNIIVGRPGQPDERVKVLDFGVAKDTGAVGSSVTATGMVVGTPGYMSPEQANAKPVTAKADLYAFGAIVYELLCGRPVFPAETVIESMIAHVHQTPELPSVRGRRLDGPMVELVMRCLEKGPEARPDSADAILGVLDDCEARLIIDESLGRSAEVALHGAETIPPGTLPRPNARSEAAIDPLAKTIPPDGLGLMNAQVMATVVAPIKVPTPPRAGTPPATPQASTPAPAPGRRRQRIPWGAVVAGLAFAGLLVAALTLAGV